MANKQQMRAITPNASFRDSGNAHQFSLNSIMTAARETAYYWDLSSDRIVWAPNAPEILEISKLDLLRTGKEFETLVAEGLTTSRRDILIAASAQTEQASAAFSHQYALASKSNGNRLWLEDHGRWYTNEDGSIASAKGVVRIINDRHNRELELELLSHNDHLTGQINRNVLFEAISDAFLDDNRENPYALMVVGINNLFMINDAFGFETGDEIIAAVAKRPAQPIA